MAKKYKYIVNSRRGLVPPPEVPTDVKLLQRDLGGWRTNVNYSEGDVVVWDGFYWRATTGVGKPGTSGSGWEVAGLISAKELTVTLTITNPIHDRSDNTLKSVCTPRVILHDNDITDALPSNGWRWRWNGAELSGRGRSLTIMDGHIPDATGSYVVRVTHDLFGVYDEAVIQRVDLLSDIQREIDEISANPPRIGSNGNWEVYKIVNGKGGYVDTGRPSSGDAGNAPYIGSDGYWYEWDNGRFVNTGILARGPEGKKGDPGERGHSFTASLAVEGELRNGFSGVYYLHPTWVYDGRDVTWEIGDDYDYRYDLGDGDGWTSWESYNAVQGELDLADKYDGSGISFSVYKTYKGLSAQANAYIPHVRDGKDGAGVDPEQAKKIDRLLSELGNAGSLMDALSELRASVDEIYPNWPQLLNLLDALNEGETTANGGLILSKIIALSNRDNKITSYISGYDGEGASMLAAGVTNFGQSSEKAISYINYDGSARFGKLYVESNGRVWIDETDYAGVTHGVSLTPYGLRMMHHSSGDTGWAWIDDGSVVADERGLVIDFSKGHIELGARGITMGPLADRLMPKVLAMGKFRPNGTLEAYDTYDGSTLSVTHKSAGNYRIRFNSDWENRDLSFLGSTYFNSVNRITTSVSFEWTTGLSDVLCVTCGTNMAAGYYDAAVFFQIIEF